MVEPTDMELYTKLAERLTLWDGSRPLITECHWGTPERHRQHNATPGMLRCTRCDGDGWKPLLAELNGEPTIPLDRVLAAMAAARFAPTIGLSAGGSWWAYCSWDKNIYESSHPTSRGASPTRAVLLAANAALDTREKP